MLMNLQVADADMVGMLAVLVSLVSLITTVFWIFVAWRAMRAHERLADAVRQLSERR
jgi:uncharacterized membrane protein